MKLWTFFSFFLLPCKYFGKAVKLILVVDTNALFVLAFVHGNDLVLVRPVEGFYPETPVGVIFTSTTTSPTILLAPAVVP